MRPSLEAAQGAGAESGNSADGQMLAAVQPPSGQGIGSRESRGMSRARPRCPTPAWLLSPEIRGRKDAAGLGGVLATRQAGRSNQSLPPSHTCLGSPALCCQHPGSQDPSLPLRNSRSSAMLLHLLFLLPDMPGSPSTPFHLSYHLSKSHSEF